MRSSEPPSYLVGSSAVLGSFVAGEEALVTANPLAALGSSHRRRVSAPICSSRSRLPHHRPAPGQDLTRIRIAHHHHGVRLRIPAQPYAAAAHPLECRGGACRRGGPKHCLPPRPVSRRVEIRPAAAADIGMAKTKLCRLPGRSAIWSGLKDSPNSAEPPDARASIEYGPGPDGSRGRVLTWNDGSSRICSSSIWPRPEARAEPPHPRSSPAYSAFRGSPVRRNRCSR